MKARKLDLETLEDRRVPSSLTSFAPLAEPMTNPVVGLVATSQPAPAQTLTTQPNPSPCKLVANHNETLVRDRTRPRKRQ
jgi:hypothetical protein